MGALYANLATIFVFHKLYKERNLVRVPLSDSQTRFFHNLGPTAERIVFLSFKYGRGKCTLGFLVRCYCAVCWVAYDLPKWSVWIYFVTVMHDCDEPIAISDGLNHYRNYVIIERNLILQF